MTATGLATPSRFTGFFDLKASRVSAVADRRPQCLIRRYRVRRSRAAEADSDTVPLYRVPSNWWRSGRELADPQIDERAEESPGRAGALGSNEETHLEGEL